MGFMRLLDLTLPSEAENLALDEALLEEAEQAGQGGEVLRLWEPQRPMVVVGRSTKIDAEVRRDACRRLDIPIFRRASGGAAIVTGPGCLMYALVLGSRGRRGQLAGDHGHRFVLGTMAAALGGRVAGVRRRGISDLALADRKVSGNSVRLKRNHLLYHGTLLYDFPLALIERCLSRPPRMPDYRRRRSHGQFVANLPLSAGAIRRAVIAAWNAVEPYPDWPQDRTAQLAAEKYAQPQWNENSRRVTAPFRA